MDLSGSFGRDPPGAANAPSPITAIRAGVRRRGHPPSVAPRATTASGRRLAARELGRAARRYRSPTRVTTYRSGKPDRSRSASCFGQGSRAEVGDGAPAEAQCVASPGVTHGRSSDLVDSAKYQGSGPRGSRCPARSPAREVWAVGANCTVRSTNTHDDGSQPAGRADQSPASRFRGRQEVQRDASRTASAASAS